MHRSRGYKFTQAALLGAMGWAFLAGELGWPPAGLGPALVRDLITNAAIFGLAALAWVGVTYAIGRLRPSENSEPNPGLEEFLETDETQGRPDYRLFQSETWAAFVAAFVFGCILILPGSAAVGLTIFGILQQGPDLNFAIPLFAGVGFLSIAGYFLTTPWRARGAMDRAEYAITDRRVILLRPPGWCRNSVMPTLKDSFYAFDGDQIRQSRHERRSRKRTDIILASEVHDVSKRTHDVSVGLIGLADWEEADRVLNRQFPKRAVDLLRERQVGVEPTCMPGRQAPTIVN